MWQRRDSPKFAGLHLSYLYGKEHWRLRQGVRVVESKHWQERAGKVAKGCWRVEKRKAEKGLGRRWAVSETNTLPDTRKETEIAAAEVKR